MRDMISAGIAIYDEFPEMYRLSTSRFFREHLPARNFFYPGHAYHQGDSYGQTRFGSDMFPLWIFDRLGAGGVYHPSAQFVPYQWIYMRRPDGQLIRNGDTFLTNSVPKGQQWPLYVAALFSASYYNDGYVYNEFLKNPSISRQDKIFEFLWRNPNLTPRPPNDLPLSKYFGFPFGWMIARTGWGQESVIAEMKVNIYNFANHQHLDAGSFQIYYKGALAIDSGIYEGVMGGYGSEHDSNYNKRTIAHNSLLIYDPNEEFSKRRGFGVNDGGQRMPNGWSEPANLEVLLGKGYKTGEVLGYGFRQDLLIPDYTYLKGDITEAYSSKVKEAKRTAVFLNLKDKRIPAVLVVFDKVVSSNPEFKKYWLLHSIEEPVVRGNEITITRTQQGETGKLVNTIILPILENTEIVPIGGPGKEFWVFGKNYPNKPRREGADESGAWRIELSPKEPRNIDYFLNVMQITDNSVSNLHNVEFIKGKEVIGIKIKDRVVFFNEISEQADKPISFKVEGNGLFKFLITDLAEGTWQLL
jgi:heparin/heparan-sulfate lyase